MKTAGLALLALAATLTGCASSSPNDVSYAAISGNPSPSMKSLTERPVDMHAHRAVMDDINSRLFWDDVNRMLFLDHPSRLSPYSIPYRSGQPR